MANDLYRIFTKRTANAIACEVDPAKNGYFKSLDAMRRQLIDDPDRSIAMLGRVPGLGRKGILEIYTWATGKKELPRSEGSLLREKQRADARARRISALKKQVERANTNIKAWNNELYELGYRPPSKFR